MRDITLARIRWAVHSLGCNEGNAADRLSQDKGAAVALILAGEGEDLSLCIIRRAERHGDPWSGHLAFPGGRRDRGDASLRETAEREVKEEVGIDLTRGALLGQLPSIPVRRLGVETGIMLASFVYYAGVEAPEVVLNDEVASSHWVPLDYLWEPRNYSQLEFSHDGTTVEFPAIRFSDSCIWGLTFKVLSNLANLVGLPLPATAGELVEGPVNQTARRI